MNTYFLTWLADYLMYVYTWIAGFFIPLIMLMRRYNRGEFF